MTSSTALFSDQINQQSTFNSAQTYIKKKLKRNMFHILKPSNSVAVTGLALKLHFVHTVDLYFAYNP